MTMEKTVIYPKKSRKRKQKHKRKKVKYRKSKSCEKELLLVSGKVMRRAWIYMNKLKSPMHGRVKTSFKKPKS